MLYKSTKVLAGVCCALLIIIVCSINVHSQTDCYDYYTPTEFCTSWQNKTIVKYGYFMFDCPITIDYSIRTCTVEDWDCTRTFVQFRVNNISFDPEVSIECEQLAQWLAPGIPFDWENLISSRYQIMYRDISNNWLSDTLFKIQYDGLSAQEKLDRNCGGEHPNCDMPDTTCSKFEMHMFHHACNDLCIISMSSSMVYFTFVNCPTIPPSCCHRKSYYCMCVDEHGAPKQINRTNVLVEALTDCEDSQSEEENCPYWGPEAFIQHYIPCNIDCNLILE